jgi:predicted glutamine amidotransferase
VCRLFGMSTGPGPAKATFWLLDARDSLAVQSRREPDGAGLGWYDADGTPHVEKDPIAAYEDAKFAREARERQSRTFIAHIRFASTGGLEPRNTHPFLMDGRLFAHNGVVEGLDALDAHLGPDRARVKGETDSERVFALITRETNAAGGDVGAGITTAVRWIAAELPLFALNVILIDSDSLWALRYPETHGLHILQRGAGGPRGGRHLEHASAAGSVRVRSADLARQPAVVVASEPMDEDPGWQALPSGTLVHVAPDLSVSSTQILDAPPAHPLTRADLGGKAAESQAPRHGPTASS